MAWQSMSFPFSINCPSKHKNNLSCGVYIIADVIILTVDVKKTSMHHHYNKYVKWFWWCNDIKAVEETESHQRGSTA